ncbi:MAG: copper amine oxidase N-terminal domain-containing protein [Oscillibacter sp.]|nr:copper amine oxidase N-terminal domain-containing protein [Oscillibacter sp.]
MKKRMFSLLLAITSLLCLTCLASASVGTKTLEAEYKNIKIEMNGQVITPKDAAGNAVEPFIVDGTTYLPVRAISEALGLDVDWDPATNTVKLTGAPSNSSNTSSVDYYPHFSVPMLDMVVGSEACISSAAEETTDSSTGNILYRYDPKKFITQDYLSQYAKILEASGFEKDPDGPLSFTYVNPVSNIAVGVSNDTSGNVSVLIMSLSRLSPKEIQLMATAYDITTGVHDLCLSAAYNVSAPSGSLDDTLIDTFLAYVNEYNDLDRGYTEVTGNAFSYVHNQIDIAEKVLASYLDCKTSASALQDFYKYSISEIDAFSVSKEYIFTYFQELT